MPATRRRRLRLLNGRAASARCSATTYNLRCGLPTAGGVRTGLAAAMSALLTDLYPLSMFQACLDEDMQGSATFELFVRTLPPSRNFLVAAGLEQALDFPETLRFDTDERAWL